MTEPREVIESYVARLGLSPVEDPSNDDPVLRRNALRHEVLPLLEVHVPGAEAALARYANMAAEDDRALEAIALTLLFVLSPYVLGTSFTLLTDNLAILFALLALERLYTYRQEGSFAVFATAYFLSQAPFLLAVAFLHRRMRTAAPGLNVTE